MEFERMENWTGDERCKNIETLLFKKFGMHSWDDDIQFT